MLPMSVNAILKNHIQLLLFGMGALPVACYVALVGRKGSNEGTLCKSRAEMDVREIHACLNNILGNNTVGDIACSNCFLTNIINSICLAQFKHLLRFSQNGANNTCICKVLG
jgi:hypothetical protein